jgi:hypothetical protein
MASVQRHPWAFVVIACTVAGCADWTPIRNARDVEGQRVKVETAGKEVVIEEVVTCDAAGFIISSDVADCRGDRKLTYDTRRDKVLVHEKDSLSSLQIALASAFAAIFVPVAIVGSALLSAR